MSLEDQKNLDTLGVASCFDTLTFFFFLLISI